MRRIVHWLRYELRTSGLYNYVYSLHRAEKQLGYDSHICYIDEEFKDGGVFKFPTPLIGTVEFSDWKVSENAVNITHDSTPHMKLDNWVAEMHGTPNYAAQNMDALTSCLYALERAELILTRFPSHVKHWEQLRKEAIAVIPPGVDLDYWSVQGKKTRFVRPIILWADTVREATKSPIDLLYAMKIISNELPTHGLKLVAVPPQEIAGYAFLCGSLRLDSCMEFPIEPMHADMDQLYRGVRDVGGVMYSDTNEEGSNSSWEAEACGLQVLHHQDSPEQIAEMLIDMAQGKIVIEPERRDIKTTAQEMVNVLETYFP